MGSRGTGSFATVAHLHMHEPESLSFLDEWRLLGVAQLSPSRSKLFGNLRIVHVRLMFTDLPTLHLTPYHKGVHWSLDVVTALFAVSSIRIGSGTLLRDLKNLKAPELRRAILQTFIEPKEGSHGLIIC